MLEIPAGDDRAIALVEAIQQGNVAGLKAQLEDNAESGGVRIVDRKGVSRTLLHVATDWPGHFPNGPDTVAALVAAGADVDAAVRNSSNGSAETALHWAASSDDVAVLDALLDHGADIEAPGAIFTGGAPMSDAVVVAQWKAARRLLDRGARTTIWQAAALGLLDRVADYCEGSAPPPDDQITNSFWHACRAGQLKTAAYLFDRGADPNWIGHDRKTPVQVGRESGAEDLIAWLRSLPATAPPHRGG